MKASVCEKTIMLGKNRYRVTSNGNWSTLMFGTFGPQDNQIPRYKWMPIPSNKVPEIVKEKA